MLTKTEKKFAIIFMFLLIAELISGNIGSLYKWHYMAKPSLLIALLLFFIVQSKNLKLKTRVIVLLALVFSLMGDIFLMFVAHSSNYFMLGLISFFIAHLFYCWVFYNFRNPKINFFRLLFTLTFYALGLFYLLIKTLGDLLIPVVCYIIIILLMVITAFLRQKKVPQKSFTFVIIGAILFMVSDSILALNKFYMPLQFSNLSIMITYGLAQFFIVLGLLKQR